MEEAATHSPTKREVDGDSHTLYFKIGDKWKRWPSPLKKEKWLGVAILSSLKMCDKCEGGGHPIFNTNTVHYGIGDYRIELYNII